MTAGALIGKAARSMARPSANSRLTFVCAAEMARRLKL